MFRNRNKIYQILIQMMKKYRDKQLNLIDDFMNIKMSILKKYG